MSLGAYLLGALDGGERTALERHLAGCPRCREELVQLAPLPGLLRHTPFEELPETAVAAEEVPRAGVATRTVPPPEPAAPPGPGPARAAGRGASPPWAEMPPPQAVVTPVSHRRGGRTGRLLTAASMGVAACATAVALGVTHGGGPAAQPVAATLAAADSTTHVAATAGLVRKAWGTQVELKLNGLPQDIRCSMVVHTRDGRTETGGTWSSGEASTATVPAATSARPEDISSIDIMSDSGRRLVELTPEK
ncbi:zf-HC2 domain-containing protein [Peterkaempfera sp. SMS 1(5)a]|uniref:zf-HC2 domain-containing protein n=1 Tax=Peterkaempfera podocarpi TaxID=3232308 RepID=UPI00366F06E9